MFKETLSFTISVVQIRTRHPHIHHPQWHHPNVLERKRVTSGELSLGPGSGGVLRVPATPNCARAPPALLEPRPQRCPPASRSPGATPTPGDCLRFLGRAPTRQLLLPALHPSRGAAPPGAAAYSGGARTPPQPQVPARPPSPAFVAASAPGQVGAFPCSLHVSGSSSSLSPCSPGGKHQSELLVRLKDKAKI